jgi:hypothetical protein
MTDAAQTIDEVDGKAVGLWGVPADEIEEMWPLCEELIEQALARSASHTVAEVKEDLIEGRGQLWAAWTHDEGVLGVMVTYIVEYPRKKVCRIWLCVGRERARWVHHLENVEDWAREKGCVEINAVVRPGWEKVLTDYKKTHVTLEKDL